MVSNPQIKMIINLSSDRRPRETDAVAVLVKVSRLRISELLKTVEKNFGKISQKVKNFQAAN
jgi:hypothetical protein